MSRDKMLFSGALACAVLLAACGGEVTEPGEQEVSLAAPSTEALAAVEQAASGSPGAAEPSPVAPLLGAEEPISPSLNCTFSSLYDLWMPAQDGRLFHGTGAPGSGGTWYAASGVHPVGHMTYGPYETGMGAGTYRAIFDLEIDSNFGIDVVAAIEVVGGNGTRFYATENLLRSDFFPKRRTFELYFKNPCHDVIEARVHFKNRATIKHHATQLKFHSFATE